MKIHPTTWFLTFILLHISISIIYGMVKYRYMRKIISRICEGFDDFCGFWMEELYYVIWLNCLLVPFIAYCDATAIGTLYVESFQYIKDNKLSMLDSLKYLFNIKKPVYA